MLPISFLLWTVLLWTFLHTSSSKHAQIFVLGHIKIGHANAQLYKITLKWLFSITLPSAIYKLIHIPSSTQYCQTIYIRPIKQSCNLYLHVWTTTTTQYLCKCFLFCVIAVFISFLFLTDLRRSFFILISIVAQEYILKI